MEITTTEGGTVVATDGHPVWEVRRQQFIDAIDLAPGDLLLDIDGDLLEVATVTGFTTWDSVYNLTVDVDHTYSVVVGNATRPHPQLR